MADSDGDTKMATAGEKPDKATIESSIEKRLDFVKKTADKMMHLEGATAGAAGKEEKGKGKRGRMSEKAEDDILTKRAELEASGKTVFADDLRLTVQVRGVVWVARVCARFVAQVE